MAGSVVVAVVNAQRAFVLVLAHRFLRSAPRAVPSGQLNTVIASFTNQRWTYVALLVTSCHIITANREAVSAWRKAGHVWKALRAGAREGAHGVCAGRLQIAVI